MSQFVDDMMGQETLLMTLANRMPRATDDLVEPVANQPTVLPQPLSTQVVQQPQEVWDADIISRDASEGDPLLEEDSMEAELVSHHSEQESELEGLDTNDPLWPLMERATHHLGIEWPAVEQPLRSLFESPSAQPHRSFIPGIPGLYQGGAVHLGSSSLCPGDFSQGLGL
ncbi:UNVERIFIED_CONTAM: hypothetical protein FKN15_070383 [Acipenser sinensis]